MTTRCIAERRLGAYLDGELPVRAARRIERHIAGCDACRRAFESLGALRAALRDAAPHPPDLDPDAFRTRVLHRIRAEAAMDGQRRSSRDAPSWLRVAAWAVPLLVVVLSLLIRPIRARMPARAGGVAQGGVAPTVQIELVNPAIVPIIDVREDGIPVIWLARSGEETPPHPG